VRKKWVPPAPRKSSYAIWAIIGGSVVMAVLIVVVLHYLFAPVPVQKVFLDDEFVDRLNKATFGFRAPRHWKIDDRRQKDHYYVMGPRDNGFCAFYDFHDVVGARAATGVSRRAQEAHAVGGAERQVFK